MRLLGVEGVTVRRVRGGGRIGGRGCRDGGERARHRKGESEDVRMLLLLLLLSRRPLVLTLTLSLILDMRLGE